MSETKWSEKDRVLPRRNSGESQFGRDTIRGEETSCCCTCSETPRKSLIPCDPEAKLESKTCDFLNSLLERAKRVKRTSCSRRETREAKLGKRNSGG
ncbi:hypothetical protein [Methanosarcina sp.]|uniref:hypothetical protein n=1 Tax=Methanosarcina sp. TaxID=2213 RepID=UPI002ABC428D|nr:hypothetical protein [Methanosarcina sp.]MDY9924766.1 hypothetical protein [Methanosarcina sp.]